MAANETACKDRGMALAIIRTITEAMKNGTQKAALESVSEWIQKASFGKLPDDYEGRKALALKLEGEMLDSMRSRMTVEERRAKAAFFLEGVN